MSRQNKIVSYSKALAYMLIALTAFAFSAVFCLKIISWHAELISSKKPEKEPIPLEQSSAVKSNGTAEKNHTGQNGNQQKMPSVGSKPGSDTAREWLWPANETLRKDAFEQFLKAQRWEATLNLGVKMPLEQLPQEERFKLVEKVYAKYAGSAFAGESESLHKAFPDFNGSIDSLRIYQKIILYDNMRTRMMDELVPEPVANVMMKAFIGAEKDAYAKTLALANLNQPPKLALTDYAKESVKLMEELFKNDPSSPSIYMKSRFDLFMDRVDSNPDLKEWLATAGTREQKKALQETLKSGKNTLSAKDFAKLQSVVRWGTVMTAYDGLGRKNLDKLFITTMQGAEWLNAIEPNSTEDPIVMAWLRSSPKWLKCINALDYDGAVRELSAQYTELFGTKMPQELEKRLKNSIALEKELWSELVTPQSWDEAKARLFERERKEMSTKAFMKALGYAVSMSGTNPKDTLNRKALHAICAINRGEDARFVNIRLNMTRQELSTRIPTEEFEK